MAVRQPVTARELHQLGESTEERRFAMALTSNADLSAHQRTESVLTSGARTDFQITSEVFALGKTIPPDYTGEGADRSPPLAWGGVPEGTRAFALIVSDPDAPAGTWHHWLLYNIPGDVTVLPEGLPREAVLQVPADARQGLNSWPSGNVGYRGPMPPQGSGPHRYYFSLFALDAPVDLDPAQATADALHTAIADHVLAEAQTMGIYERKR
jgi:Raf kinase inhibitor-like YbhB/YbcL family protein